MLLVKRKSGSQRSSKPVRLTIEPNWTGEGGYASLIFRADDTYVVIKPETEADVRALMSQAHIIHHNFKDA